MVQRKIMSLGKSSFVISIPKDWMKMNDLNKGDRVSLDVQPDGSLVVQPTQEDRETERVIHLPIEAEEDEESIARRIIASYLDGYTRIRLTSGKIFTATQRKAIRRIVATLYMMVIESHASSIVLQTLIDETKISVTTSIERIHLITYAMCRDILKIIINWDRELALSVASIEEDVDQLRFFLLRMIRGAAISPSLGRQLGLDPLDCLDYQTLVHRIERIADHNASIAHCLVHIIENGIGLPGDMLEILTKTAEMAFDSYNQAVEGFMSKDIYPMNDIIDKQRQVESLLDNLTPLPLFRESAETSILVNIITIRESIKKISHYASDIAELTIDRAYKYI
jgi:phosphate uptake regulator